MKNKLYCFIKKYWIILMLCIAALATLGIYAWAKYEESINNMKRVIVSVADSDKLFTSNYMEGRLITRTRPIAKNTEKKYGDYYLVEVVVRNFSPSDPQRVYENPIPFKFNAKLVDISGYAVTAHTDYVKYDKNGDGSNPASLTDFELVNGFYSIEEETGTLQPAESGIHEYKYRFLFHKNLIETDTNNIYIQIEAVPDDSVISEVGSLSGRIGISQQSAEVVQTWYGYFNDEGANEEEQEEGNEQQQSVQNSIQAARYDGFNYVITGNGTRTVQLSWDTSKLELSKISLAQMKNTITNVDDSTAGTLIFTVDSKDCSRYDIQFYMTSSINSYYDTWAKIKDYVTFSPNVTTS